MRVLFAIGLYVIFMIIVNDHFCPSIYTSDQPLLLKIAEWLLLVCLI